MLGTKIDQTCSTRWMIFVCSYFHTSPNREYCGSIYVQLMQFHIFSNYWFIIIITIFFIKLDLIPVMALSLLDLWEWVVDDLIFSLNLRFKRIDDPSEIQQNHTVAALSFWFAADTSFVVDSQFLIAPEDWIIKNK